MSISRGLQRDIAAMTPEECRVECARLSTLCSEWASLYQQLMLSVHALGFMHEDFRKDEEPYVGVRIKPGPFMMRGVIFSPCRKHSAPDGVDRLEPGARLQVACAECEASARKLMEKRKQ